MLSLSHRVYKVKMSYLEIYNEMIHDLLRGGGNNPEAAKLDLREDPSGHVNVAGLSSVRSGMHGGFTRPALCAVLREQCLSCARWAVARSRPTRQTE